MIIVAGWGLFSPSSLPFIVCLLQNKGFFGRRRHYYVAGMNCVNQQECFWNKIRAEKTTMKDENKTQTFKNCYYLSIRIMNCLHYKGKGNDSQPWHKK